MRRPGPDLTARELLVGAELLQGAVACALLVNTVNLRRLVETLGRVAVLPLCRRFPLGHEGVDGPERLARVAGLAAHRVQGSRACLVRSALLFWLLSARGLTPMLRLGVTKTGGAFSAHAWVELDGRAVGEPDEGPEFVRLVALVAN